MAKKKKKSAAPSGLSISRDGLKFTISWKIPAKKYEDGQWLWYRLHTKNAGASKWDWTKWKKINVGKSATKKTVALNAKNYYPVSSKLLNAIEFKVKGKTKSDKKHTYTAAHSTKTFAIHAPNAPSVSYSLDDADANKGTFTWSTSYEANDARHFARTQVQTALMINYKGAIANARFSNSSHTGASGTWAITEDGSPTQNKTFCRIVRAKSRGCAGDSGWSYAYHYYSIPGRPNIQSTGSKEIGSSSRYVWANWVQASPRDRPVDSMELQYAIDTPESGERYTGTSWSTGVTVAYHDYTVSADFNTDDGIAEDQIMWTRVQSTHDKKYAYSEPRVAARGALKSPSFDTVSATGTTLTINSVERNTEVPDAKTAVWMKIGNEEKGIIAITDKEGTITVACPDVSGGTEYQIALKNFTGTSTPQNGASGTTYKLSPLMQSGWIYSETRKIAVPPKNITAMAVASDTVELTWDWSWKNADAATVAWADHEDAWISTEAPTTYDVEDRETTWHIGSLESAKTYYFRVRLRDTSGDEEVLSPWSDTVSVSLSETPTTPTLATTENYLALDDTVICSVGYTGNSKASIKIAEAVNDEPVKGKDGNVVVLMMSSGMETLSETIENINKIYTANGLLGNLWNVGEIHYLKAMVTAQGGKEGAWSDSVAVEIVAKPAIDSVATNLVSESTAYNPSDVTTETSDQAVPESSEGTTNYLEQLPLTIVPSFGDSVGTAKVTIVRDEDYYILRPDGLKEQHFANEIIASFTGSETDSYAIDLSDLIGQMDDGARYSIQIAFTDIYDHVAEKKIPFVVRWKHQPEVPTATVNTIADNKTASIVVAKPTTYADGDTFDLYRMSVDRAELILENGIYGQKYVDPYPALNEYGGILVVNKTANGDYITSDSSFAWLYSDFSIEYKKAIIDFDGESIEIQYNIDCDNSWDKDFERTVYLGGSVQGDWNPAVTRDLKIDAVSISLTEPTMIEQMRRLATYPGICHVRTPDGSSFSCDIQVSEKKDHDNKMRTDFSLTIKKVDSEELDAVTEEQWSAEHPNEVA